MHFLPFRKTSYTTSRLLLSEPGPSARLLACHIAGERALPCAQMVQQPTVYNSFDIMEKVLLEQG